MTRFNNFHDYMMGYAHIQGTRPQTLAYGLTDSLVGQLAWTEFERGGHFAALEGPDFLVCDIREFFRQLHARASQIEFRTEFVRQI